MVIISSEVTFELNKYNQPKTLSDEDSLVQIILMALFMKKGNLPSIPNVGVDITQYFYKSAEEFNEQKLLADLEFSCGALMTGGVYITNVRFKIVDTVHGAVFVLAMNVDGISNKENNTLLLGIQRKGEAVSFNYEFTHSQL